MDVSTVQTTHPYSSEVANELDKAKRNMKNALTACRGDIRHRISTILEEMDSVTSSLKETAPLRSISTEYKMVEKIFGYFQILSACMMAFAHGANDVANAIGPVSAAYSIIVTGVVMSTTEVPTWALALGGFGIVVGLATWGWRVIETIGKKITELTPTRGFAAEFGAAATILIASRLGLPISTTHTLVGSVIGVGLARGIEALNLSMTRDIVISWIVTVPACALLSVGFYYMLVAAFG
jgi:PiT family inorganic phosphate transporter